MLVRLDRLRSRFRMFALLIAGIAVLNACIVEELFSEPWLDNLCDVNIGQIRPLLAGTFEHPIQIEWLPNSTDILLKSHDDSIYIVHISNNKNKRLENLNITSEGYDVASQVPLVALKVPLTQNRFESQVYSAQDMQPLYTLPDLAVGAISRDGRYLALSVFERDGYWVEVLDIQDPLAAPVEAFKGGRQRNHSIGDWSSQSDWFTIVMPTETGTKVFVVEWPSRKLIPLHEFRGCHDNPVWSPVSDKLVYQGNPNGNWDIFIETPGNDDARNLTNTPDINEYQPAWSPDGSKIVYVAFETVAGDRQNLYILDVTTGEKRRIDKTRGEWESLPKWSPNGKKIAYIAEKEGDLYLNIVEPTGENRTELIRIP